MLRLCPTRLACGPVARRQRLVFDAAARCAVSTQQANGDRRASTPPADEEPLWAKPLGKFLHRATLVALSEVGYSRCRTIFPKVVVFEERSAHGNGLVRILQHGPWRGLHFNDTEQGLTYVGSAPGSGKAGGPPTYWNEGAAVPFVLGFEYTRTMAAAVAAFSSVQGLLPLRMLCVGLGAGALPAFLAHNNPRSDVAVLEIDPVVIRLVKDVLGLQFSDAHSVGELLDAPPATADAPFRVLEADAGAAMTELAQELRAGSRRAGGERSGVDVLVLDAYEERARVPTHLKAPAFLDACAACLAPDGVVVVNMLNGTPDSRARKEVAAYARLLSQHFGCLYSIKVEEQQYNVILVACRPGSPAGVSPVTRHQLVEAARGVALRQRWVFDGGDLVEKLFRCTVGDDGVIYEEVVGRPPALSVGALKESSAASHEYVEPEDDKRS
jgi:hypothetical protein